MESNVNYKFLERQRKIWYIFLDKLLFDIRIIRYICDPTLTLSMLYTVDLTTLHILFNYYYQ